MSTEKDQLVYKGMAMAVPFEELKKVFSVDWKAEYVFVDSHVWPKLMEKLGYQ